MKKFRLFFILAFLFWSSGLSAEPIRVARFIVSGNIPLECEHCLPQWRDALEIVLSNYMSDKLVVGHIVLVDLSDPGILPLVTHRNPNNVFCGNFVGPTRYDPEKIPQPLPVHLQTVPRWADMVGADIAFSGSFYKFQDNGGVRAKPACGEMIGINLRDGHLDWPPESRPELLNEGIDYDVNSPSYALLLNANRTAEIKLVTSFEELNNAAFGVGGSALYIGDWENAYPASKPTFPAARLAIGIMNDPSKIIFVLLEGENANRKGLARGHKIARMTDLMRHLHAVAAINLDGSGSVNMIIRNRSLGVSSRPADSQGVRPVANHIGFRLSDGPVTWTSYEARKETE